MTDSLFRPFETHLDRESAREILKSTLIGAEDGELFLERSRSEVLSFDDGRLRTSSFDASEGFGLRAVQGERVGYAHATEISEQAMRRSAGTVRLAVVAGGGPLCAAPPATNRRLYSDHNPLNDSSFPAKIDILREIDAYARGLDRRVVQVSATIAASHQEVVILRAEGPDVSDNRPMVRMNVQLLWSKTGNAKPAMSAAVGAMGWVACLNQAIGNLWCAKLCASLWSTSPLFPHLRGSWMWPWVQGGPASYCMKRLAMGSKVISTAKAPLPSQVSWAKGSRPQVSRSWMMAQYQTAADRSALTMRAHQAARIP